MGATSAIAASDCAAALGALRDRPPLVQSLTNIVVAQWTANVLLAVGAAPAMVDNPRRGRRRSPRIAGGVLVNLGTPYDDTVVAMERAVTAATDHGTPWVLDPVAAGALEWRTKVALDLLALGRPAVIRGNASEVLALTGGAGGKGVDSAHTPESALDAARALAVEHRTVVAVSGPGRPPHRRRPPGAGPQRPRVAHPGDRRGLRAGRAGGRLRRRRPGPAARATAATATLTVAAESAAATSRGPGSFAVALLDELAALTPARLADATRVS